MNNKKFIFYNGYNRSYRIVTVFKIEEDKKYSYANAVYTTNNGYYFDKNLKHVNKSHILRELNKLSKLFYIIEE